MTSRKLHQAMSALALGALTFMANASKSEASYFEGYVCDIHVYGSTSSSPPYATLYQSPDCSGAYVGFASTRYPIGDYYPEQVDRIYQGLLSSAANDLRVGGQWTSIFGSSTKYIQSFDIYTD